MMWLAASGALLFAEVFVAAVLFIHGLPHRDRLAMRIGCVLAVCVVFSTCETCFQLPSTNAVPDTALRPQT